MKTNEIFPKGQKAAANFTGDAWVKMLSSDVATFDAMTYNVIFAPGSRNYWHAHSGGQILLCTSGEGYYQEKGKPAQKLKAGDVVEIKPNVIHWHGATATSEFVHIGITPQVNENNVTWLEPVTQEEYTSLD
jgi:quercetin dioxygenase-like cupin family protein